MIGCRICWMGFKFVCFLEEKKDIDRNPQNFKIKEYGKGSVDLEISWWCSHSWEQDYNSQFVQEDNRSNALSEPCLILGQNKKTSQSWSTGSHSDCYHRADKKATGDRPCFSTTMIGTMKTSTCTTSEKRQIFAPTEHFEKQDMPKELAVHGILYEHYLFSSIEQVAGVCLDYM